MLIRVLLLPLRRRWRRPRDPRKPACWRSWSSKRKVSARSAPCAAGGRHRDCSPVRGKHRAPGMQPDSWGRSPALGKHPAPGKQPGSQGHCLTGGGCSPILRVAAWFRGWNRVPGDTASLRGCSPAPGNAAPLQGTQCRSRERSQIPGDAAPLPGAAARALRGTALLSSAPELESESQVSCSPNCACHRALRGHPGITRTAHAFK